MAKIKLQAGKVLTTNGKPRCQCCTEVPPEECCPYPADKLDVLYRRQDLPETLTIRRNDDSQILLMSLTNSGPNIYEGYDSEGNLYRMAVNTQVFGNWELEGVDPSPGSGDGWSGVQDWSGQPCLFWDYSGAEQSTWPLTPPDPQVSGGFSYPDDNFQDTYSVTQTNPPRTFTVTRESLCIWRERASDGLVRNSLYYDTNANEQTLANSGGAIGAILWRFNGSRRTDAGPYNSPAGEYSGWTVT